MARRYPIPSGRTPMKTKLRIRSFVVLGILGLASVFLFGPALFHCGLRATTDASELQLRQSESRRMAVLAPQALNGPDPKTFHRYSVETFRWFRVRGMIDPTCEDTSLKREWSELFTCFTARDHAGRPQELATKE
jgi:hypothetical protein